MVVGTGVTFNPSSITLPLTADATLEIQDGATATLPALSWTGLVSYTFNYRVCGSVTHSGAVSAGGTGSMNIHVASSGTLNLGSYNLGVSGVGTVCNEGAILANNLDILATSSSTVTNHGYIQLAGSLNQNSSADLDLCSGSLIEIATDFTSLSGLVTGYGACGALAVSGTSTCNLCTFAGTADICDKTGSAPSNSPNVDADIGGTWGGSVSFCTCAALPIELITFTGRYANNRVELAWVSGSEVNNDFYTVERSTDGKYFESVGQVKGMGNTSERTFYTFTDESPAPGASYYRLKQTDHDGTMEMLAVISVDAKSENESLTVYPNPAHAIPRYFVTSPEDARATVTLRDMSGRIVYRDVMALPAGTSNWPIPLSDLPAGVYDLQLEKKHTSLHKVFVVR